MTGRQPWGADAVPVPPVRRQLQRVIPIESPRFIPVQRLGSGPDWAGEFGRVAPLALEIGCGTGHFVVQLARQRPQCDFLAIDIYNKGCLKTCSKLDAEGIANVRVLRVEARELLLNHIAPHSLQAVYINCPDPWPKKRHRDRRLVNGEFLELVLHRLQPDGEFFFASDQGDYAEQVAGLLAALPAFRNPLAVPVASRLPDYPLSKYMRRFLDQGLPVYFIHRQREAAAALPELQLTELRNGFRSCGPRVPA